MDWKKERAIVVGTGVSGIAATELLLKKDVDVTLFDGNAGLDTAKLYEKAPSISKVPLILGELREVQIRQFGMVVLSPGVPTDIPMVDAIREAGIPIWGEIELAWHFGSGRLVAITGTNGKTTTTALTGAILKNYFDDVRVVGNIGIPYTQEAAGMTEETVTVAEISSFQLETIHEFIRMKQRITENQSPEDVVVLNYEDAVLRQFGETLEQRVIFFSSAGRLDDGWYLEGEMICRARGGVGENIININELNLLGRHNYENVMAAAAMADSIGVPVEKIVEVLRSFTAV